jgi:signal peptidase II
MPYFILAAFLVAADQLVKYLVMTSIPLGGHVPFLPLVLDLTYVQNTGAAFSLFSGHTWLLTLVSLIMSAALAVALGKKLFSHPLGQTILALLLGGAVGNLIDRALRGYVVDMFNLLFMNFAVFNLADICVVVGGIGAGVYYLLFFDRLEPALTKRIKL